MFQLITKTLQDVYEELRIFLLNPLSFLCQPTLILKTKVLPFQTKDILQHDFTEDTIEYLINKALSVWNIILAFIYSSLVANLIR